MATLYVTEQGAQVEKEYQKLVVTKEDETLVAVQAQQVTEVVLVGNIGVTTPAVAFLLERAVPVVYLNSRGRLRGRLVGAAARNLDLRHQQYRRSEDATFCLSISRTIVRGKLENYRALALRMARAAESRAAKPATGDPSTPVKTGSSARTAVGDIDSQLDAIARAPDLGTLRGIEGAGSKAYFGALRAAFQHDLGFAKRARRPPPDPINALLSFGYTMLGENLFAALEIVGLDPYDGFYHADRYGRPALALDLMEEFRGVIVDSLALNLINREIIGAEDFEKAEDAEHGVFLKHHALRKFLHHYSARLNTMVRHPYFLKSWTYQKCFEAQARLMRQVIEGKASVYLPFRTK